MAKLVYELQILLDLVMIQIRQILPYWLAGTLLGSILSVYASKSITQLAARIKSQRYSFIQALLAAMLGVASPVCMYGTLPVGVLGKEKVPQYILATFMISSILLNPNLFLISFALGMPLALLRLFFSVAGGMLAGALVFVFFQGKDFFDLKSFADDTGAGKNTGKKSFLKDLGKSMRITAPYLMIGIVLTALFDRYFPQQAMDALFLQNKGLSVLFMASAGVPVYLCGGGTIPLLRAWLEAGMSPGSAVAFMVSGPSTKLTNLSAVKSILGTRHFVFYIAYNLLFAVFAGLATEFVFNFLP
ncbi:permease [Candidatus Formimonas warabiya]|uniref:Permease n=1 Tax=Formimonas warabiya TaxID=1761012 RepID=A0A3G1KXC3_FORW1|nr:permease [Candidatus Formimonas warabiya]ATW26855.1 hypothetical protein DCMF_20680 [Candidatus Formimonas warabiya]